MTLDRLIRQYRIAQSIGDRVSMLNLAPKIRRLMCV